ncbi:hypothetical protein ABPG75_003049 [Micractinium tetrahymenae]
MTSRPAAGTATAAAAAAAAEPAAGSALWQAITERYDVAQRDAAATMTETNTEVVEEGGVRFVLRVAAKLRDKPKPPADGEGKPKKEWRNPFLPYERALWVADLGASHVLLLNKFNIVPWHCLVVTADFRSQLDDMDAADWAATWAVLQSMPHGGLAFYNCGPVSVCTRDFMMLVPRRQESDGPVSCNSVAFAGSIFVRSEEEVRYVAQRGPLSILAATGYEW